MSEEMVGGILGIRLCIFSFGLLDVLFYSAVIAQLELAARCNSHPWHGVYQGLITSKLDGRNTGERQKLS